MIPSTLSNPLFKVLASLWPVVSGDNFNMDSDLHFETHFNLTMMFMPTIFKLVFQHTDLEGTSITDLEGIGSVRLGGLLTWRAPTLEGSLGA